VQDVNGGHPLMMAISSAYRSIRRSVASSSAASSSGNELIHRAKDYGLAHPGATAEDTLTALGEAATADNSMYAGAGLLMAAREREDTAAGVGGTQLPAWVTNEEHPYGGPMVEIDSLKWFKSSFSAAGACVEVAHLPNGAGVALRDAKDRSREPHFFTREEWDAFHPRDRNTAGQPDPT
jgi:Domain of unknown function (DUF397)